MDTPNRSFNVQNKVGVKKLHGKNSVIGSAFNLLACIIGAGMVTLPNAFMNSGIVSGFLLLLFFAVVSAISLRILFMAIHYAPKIVDSAESLAEMYFGKIFKKIQEVVMFCTLAAPLITFLCIIGDSACPILQLLLGEDSYLASREFVISFFAIVIVYPLTLFRTLYALRFTSVIGVISGCYLIFLIPITSIINIFRGSIPKEIEGKIFFNTGRYLGICPEIIMSVPIYAFSFWCHVVAVPVHNELKNVSLRKLDVVSVLSFLFVLVGYCCVGFFGFFYFGDSTPPDILTSYGATSIEVSIGRFCIALSCTFHYPIVSTIQRTSAKSVLFNTTFRNDGTMCVPAKADVFTNIVLSTVLFVGNLVMALLIPDITVVLGFAASVGVPFLTFGFPGMLSWKLARRNSSKCEAICLYVVSVFLIALTLVMLVVCPVTNLFHVISERNST